MSRPCQGDGIKTTIVRRGDRFYAYEITSVMENGKKRTISKYLGRADPVTGEVLPKIPEKSPEHRKKIADERNLKVIDNIHVADYGASHLLHNLQKRISIGEDLNRSFGRISETIMTIAILLMQSGTFAAIEGISRRTWTTRMFGISGSLDSGTLSRLLKDLGQRSRGNMEKFFESRIRRNSGILSWDTTTIGCNSDMDGLAEYVLGNKDGEDIRQVKLGLATDRRGVPLMYRYFAGNVSDTETVKHLSKDIENYGGKDVLFVMDRGFCSGANVRFMLVNGYRFVIPATTSSKAVKKLLTDFGKSKDSKDRMYNGRAYKVWETSLDVVGTERSVADGSEAYGFVNAKNGAIRAYVCFCYKKYADEMQNHMEMIDSLKRFASQIDSKDPLATFRERAGNAMKFFNATVDGRRIEVDEKPNSMSFQENRAGLFVLLTSGDVEWETAMQAYDSRRLTEQGFDRKKGEDGRFRTSDKDSMAGREFVRFIELILRCEMSAILRDKGGRFGVDEVISMTNCVQVVEYNGTRTIREIDKKERDIFGLFEVPVPREVEEGLMIFDPQLP